jgi:hypothetical protein
MSEPYELGRFDLTLSVSIAGVIVPAVGCAVNAYRKSALVSSVGPTTIAPAATVALSVYDAGPIAINDTVFINTTTGVILNVSAVDFNTITLQNPTGSPVIIAQYDRIVPFSSRPTMFRDERGTTAYGTFSPNTNASGGTSCYARERSLDFIVSGGNLSAPVHLPDQTAVGGGLTLNPADWRIRFDSFTNDAPRWVEMMNYISTLNAPAIIQCPPGGLSRVSSMVLIDSEDVAFIGNGRSGFLTDSATDAIFESIAFYTTFDGIKFERSGGASVPVLRARGGNSSGRGYLRRCSLNSAGAGIEIMAPDWTIDDLAIYGSSFTGIASVKTDGVEPAPERTTVRNVHGVHSTAAGGMGAAFRISKGAINTRFEDVSLAPLAPSFQGGTVFLQESGGGAVPEGTVIRGGRFSSGYAGNGLIVTAGDLLVVGATAFDCLTSYQVTNCTIVTFSDCTTIGSRSTGFKVETGSGIVRIIDPVCSDSSAATDNAADHIQVANGRNDVHIIRPIMGNFIRQNTNWARDGVRFDTGAGTFSSGSCFGAVGQPGAGQRGINGKLVSIPDSVLTTGSLDISHNAGQRLTGILGTATVDHIGMAPAVRTVTTGINLDLRNVNTIVLNGAGVLAISTVTNGTEGQPVTIYNQSASTATITDSSTIDVNGSPLNVPQNNIIHFLYVNAKLRVASALVAP